MLSKLEIRKQMLARRYELSVAERGSASEYICARLLASSLPKHSIIAGYKAMRGEVDIAHALLSCHDRKYRLCLPSISDPEKIMHFLEWRPKMALKIGAFGIHVPDSETELVPDILWIPLLAFDRSGIRLGYGGGYYDATLAHMRKNNPLLQAVGIAFSFQEVDKLPHDAHDVRLDSIVTEQEIINISKHSNDHNNNHNNDHNNNHKTLS